MIKRAIKKYKILAAAAIFAVLVLHFAWQFSFIQKENLRIAETQLKDAQPEMPKPEIAVNEEKSQIKIDRQPDIIETGRQIAESRLTKAEKTIEANSEKTLESTAHRQPEPKNAPKSGNKKIVRETESERLRRAEKLLTGM